MISRVVAGVGAAMIMPVTLSVITSSFPASERARAVGVWAGFSGAGGILGLFTSSVMVDYFTWPWVFVLPAVLAVAALIGTLRAVPNSREHDGSRFDTVGSFLSAIAIGAVVLGVHEGPEVGWDHWLTVTSLTVGVLAAIGFVLWENRQDAPLFDVRLFANRWLSAGSLTLLTLFGVMFGLFLVLIQFLQAVVGWSALASAAGMLPMAAVMMPLASFAPRIAERVGTRRVLVTGLCLFLAGLVLLGTMVSVEGGYWSILPGLMVLGTGMGLAMSPSTTAITAALPMEKQGVASALNDTVRELGGALGIAVLGSVLNAGYRAGMETATSGMPPEAAERASEGIGAAMAIAPRMGEQGADLMSSAQHALVDGWQNAMWLGAAIAAATLVFVALRTPRGAEYDVIAIDEGKVQAAGGSADAELPNVADDPQFVPSISAGK
jgi:EmrB/QacA subfamily drug resistance transporter